jgi:hypothetical protein
MTTLLIEKFLDLFTFKAKGSCCRSDIDTEEWIPTPRIGTERRKRSETVYMSDAKEIRVYMSENHLQVDAVTKQ